MVEQACQEPEDDMHKAIRRPHVKPAVAAGLLQKDKSSTPPIPACLQGCLARLVENPNQTPCDVAVDKPTQHCGATCSPQVKHMVEQACEAPDDDLHKAIWRPLLKPDVVAGLLQKEKSSTPQIPTCLQGCVARLIENPNQSPCDLMDTPTQHCGGTCSDEVKHMVEQACQEPEDDMHKAIRRPHVKPAVAAGLLQKDKSSTPPIPACLQGCLARLVENPNQTPCDVAVDKPTQHCGATCSPEVQHMVEQACEAPDDDLHKAIWRPLLKPDVVAGLLQKEKSSTPQIPTCLQGCVARLIENPNQSPCDLMDTPTQHCGGTCSDEVKHMVEEACQEPGDDMHKAMRRPHVKPAVAAGLLQKD